jgi:hypothetical protein
MKQDIPKDRKNKIDSRPPRMFVANDPGLDFLNSIGTPVDTVVEWIANGEDLLAWLVEAKLVDAVQVAAIRANSFPGELDEVAAQARALREWFRGFVLVHMGRPLTAKAQKLLEPLNRLLERDEGYGAIMPRSARPHNHRAPSGGTRVPCSPALESTQLNTSANRPGHGAPRLLGRFLFGERMRS